jgi:hypothetical protein
MVEQAVRSGLLGRSGRQLFERELPIAAGQMEEGIGHVP